MFINYKIRTRLFIGFGIVLGFLVMITFIGLNSMDNIHQDLEKITGDRFPKTVWANDIIDAVNATVQSYLRISVAQDPAVLEREKQQMNEMSEIISSRIDSLKATVKSEKGKELLAEINKVRNNKFLPLRNQFIALVEQGNYSDARTLLSGELTIAQNEFIGSIRNLKSYEFNMINQIALQSDESLNSATSEMMILGGVALALAIFIAFSITKSISAPVNLVAERINQLQSVCITNLGEGLVRMSRGDLSAKVEKATKHLNLTQQDEIGDMARTVDQMITKAQSGIDSYELVRDKIKMLIDEAGQLTKDAQAGLLDNRADTARFEGAYKEIVTGINDMLDAVLLPIQDGAKVLEVMATGDLTARVTADYKGQHQKIKESINKLGDTLESVLGEISVAIEQTASSSAEISSSTEQMAAGAQEQSAQASEVSTAVEQMTSSVIENTKNASTAAQIATEAGNIAREGGNRVQETIKGMVSIATVVSSSAETIGELSKGSSKIGEIIEVIDEIAGQTNLLALNAAIEAARAGEQGRGFAVVADEVRKLAERTKKATKEIADMIFAIQNNTNNVVKSINHGLEEVEKGKILSAKAGESIEQIVTSAQKVVDVVNQVASASEEQSTASEQISKNIEGISSVTHQTASGIQQIARSAENLNKLTENLQQMISRFRLTDGGSGNKFMSSFSVRQNGKIVKA